MTHLEYIELGKYAAELWPKLSLNASQSKQWEDRMYRTNFATAKQALDDAYAAGTWAVPTLPEVLRAVHAIKRGDGGVVDADFPPEVIQQVDREEAEEAQALADWTTQELEDGKAEIMRREVGMKEFRGMAADGSFWRHFLCERYVHHRVTLFPGKVQVFKNPGAPDRIVRPAPMQMSRDAYWDQLARKTVAT